MFDGTGSVTEPTSVYVWFTAPLAGKPLIVGVGATSVAAIVWLVLVLAPPELVDDRSTM